MVKRDDAMIFGAGLLVGAVAGSILSLLFAPKSGKEMREDIAEKATEAKEKSQAILESGKERVGQVYDRGREVVESTREKAMDVIETGRHAFMPKGEESKETKAPAASVAKKRAHA